MKKTPLNKVSKKPHRRLLRFVPKIEIEKVKARSGGQCERMLTYTWGKTRCVSNAMPQPHHILARSQGGEDVADNLADLCFGCHHYITNNPSIAYYEGISKPYKNYTR